MPKPDISKRDVGPYQTTLTAAPFKSYLPTVIAGVNLEAMGVDPPVDAGFARSQVSSAIGILEHNRILSQKTYYLSLSSRPFENRGTRKSVGIRCVLTIRYYIRRLVKYSDPVDYWQMQP